MRKEEFQQRLQGIELFPVVPLEPGDTLLQMNLTASNKGLDAATYTNTELFSNWVEALLQSAGARYGIGGYGEHRTIYARSEKFDTHVEEPRRLHLGIDVWGPAETPVYAPLAGTVHSVADNDFFGDYGGTVILRHEVGGFVFHTLYGHLSRASLEDKAEGATVAAGERIASFGIPEENGHWPPHLHFQAIIDMQGRRGDYPGVCCFSEKEQWLANSPDPDVLLDMMERVR
ncbi:MAG: peptidase M23 [Chitinophagaceae bacterium]|nr:MAG: peptidase M23 [Chitinophagaceae bacterium]